MNNSVELSINLNQRDYVISLLQRLNITNPLDAFTRQELFADMPESDRFYVFNDDINALGKTLDALRKIGKVINGESEYRNGKSTLTWKIHPDFASPASIATPEPENITPAAEPVAPAADLSTPDSAAHEISFEEAFADLEQPLKWQATDINATVLDTNDQLEAALVDLIKQHRAYKHQPARPSLNNPIEKRLILSLLSDSLLVNPDYKTHLAELRDFVEQLEEVALEHVA